MNFSITNAAGYYRIVCIRANGSLARIFGRMSLEAAERIANAIRDRSGFVEIQIKTIASAMLLIWDEQAAFCVAKHIVHN